MSWIKCVTLTVILVVGLVRTAPRDARTFRLLERLMENHQESRSALGFAALVTCKLGTLEGWKYYGYGCFCGFGGGGTPVDAVDQCCKVHDECYYQAEQNCWWLNHPYVVAYNYDYNCTKCTDGKKSCAYQACACDLAAAECFANNPYDPQYAAYDTRKC